MRKKWNKIKLINRKIIGKMNARTDIKNNLFVVDNNNLPKDSNLPQN